MFASENNLLGMLEKIKGKNWKNSVLPKGWVELPRSK
jgi:hypothetical protein